MKDKRITTGYIGYRKVIFDPVNYGVVPEGGKLMSKAQKWAKQRNFAKFRLRGAYACIGTLAESSFMTPHERNKLLTAETEIQHIIFTWENENVESKKKYMEGNK